MFKRVTSPCNNSLLQFPTVQGVSLCAALGGALAAPLLLFGSSTRPVPDVRAAVPLISTQLAMVVGLTAIARFVDNRRSVQLYVGAVFLGAACLYGLQLNAWRSEPRWAHHGSNGNPADAFLALAMLTAAIAWPVAQRLQAHRHLCHIALSAALTISFLAVCFWTFWPHSWSAGTLYVQGLSIFAMYCIAAILFLRFQGQSRSRMVYWFATSSAILAAAQALVLAGSQYGLGPIVLTGQSASVAGVTCVLLGLFSDHGRRYSAKRRSKRENGEEVVISPLILDHLSDAIVIISLSGEIKSLNRAAQKLFRYRTEQVSGRSLSLLIQSTMNAAGESIVPYSHLGGGAGRYHDELIARGRRANGSHFAAQLHLCEFKLGSEMVLASIVRVIPSSGEGMQQLSLENAELTRDKMLMQQSNVDLTRSNVDLKQFAYVASHDLQEPLRKVIAFCQLLRDEYGHRLDQNAQTYIQYAVDGSLRMKALVQDLLTYSRVETQGKPLESVDANVAFREALENLAFAIGEASAQITSDELPRVLADRAQLVRLFQNLIANAIKYRGCNPPTVNVTCRSLGEWAEFRVTDNGAGIAPEYHQRIFVIFQRLHPREDYSGTGIGLAVCKRIVERAGGRIWVESTLGAGSEFCFTLLKANHQSNFGWSQYELQQPSFIAEAN